MVTQNEALAILKTGANIFLTGEPGSGKTHTINQYVAYLRSYGIEPAITASTGIAATHIGGYTIHSWSGIGVLRDFTKYDLDRIESNRNVVRRVSNSRVLIIDEVSMLSAQTFSMIDTVCRGIRRNQKPFGGLQVVLVGDFFQLPPVSHQEDEDVQGTIVKNPLQTEFAYRSRAWKALNPLVCYLSEQHRQEDKLFLEILSAMRKSIIKEEHKQILRTRYSPKPKDGITQLYSHNIDVDEINNAELAKLFGKPSVFQMESRGPEKLIAALKRGCLSPETLSLKVGARVMFTRNDVTTHRYVNGTLGVITGFSKESGNPIVKTNSGKTILALPDEWRIEDSGRVLARITQVPLRLAWAMTVHKSQGMSLDAAHMDLSDSFEYGQGYVALSRVRTLAGLSLAGLNHRALEVHPEILAKDRSFREQSHTAREKFSSIPQTELRTMHNNFVQACGGKRGAPRTDKSELSNTMRKEKHVPSCDITRGLILQKLSIREVAKKRGMTVETIVSHLEQLVEYKKITADDLTHIKQDLKRFEKMRQALEIVYQKEKQMLLSPARAILGEGYNYDEVRLARLFIRL